MKHKFIPLKARKSPAKKIARNKKKRKGARALKKRSSATNYLLYKKRIRDAELLRGDPELADRLILSSRSESPYYSIVLSFRPDCYKRPDAREMLKNIMDSYESVLFAGLDLPDVCRYWVLHTDHDRFELHLIVVNQHLSSGKVLKLAWKRHFGDRKIFNVWQELINIAYQLPSPFDPKNERLLDKPPKTLPKELKPDFYEIDRKVAKAIQRSLIKDRNGIVEVIEELDDYTAEARKDYIKIKKSTGEVFRLRGRKYDADFNFQAYYSDRDLRAEEYSRPESVNQREEDYLNDLQNLIEERRRRLPKDHTCPKEGWKGIKQKPLNSKSITQEIIKNDELRRNKETVLWSPETANPPNRQPAGSARVQNGPPKRNQSRQRREIQRDRRGTGSYSDQLRRIARRIKFAANKLHNYFRSRELLRSNRRKPDTWTTHDKRKEARINLRHSDGTIQPMPNSDPRNRKNDVGPNL